MTTNEKLAALYLKKNHLSYITKIFVEQFHNAQKGVMSENDAKFIENIYPVYFSETGKFNPKGQYL